MSRPRGSCGLCPLRWTSLTQAHCRGCCRQFSSVDVCDLHDRKGFCEDPATMTRRNGDPVYTLVEGLEGPVWRRFNKKPREFTQ